MTSEGMSAVAPNDARDSSRILDSLRRGTRVIVQGNLAPALVCLVFCGLAIGVILTKRPWCDEGWFASIVYNVIHHGVMGLTVLDPHGFVFAPEVRGIDRHTYWVLPNYIFGQAVWCSILGLNVFTFRLFSTAWGCVALVSWHYILCRLTGDRRVALVATLILALEQNFITAGASGRMDMMCAALNLAASAIYLRLRGRFHMAVFAACCILAISLLTHPNALFGAILLTVVVLIADREQIRWRTLLIAGAPFVASLGLWLLYVLQAPDLFTSQMQAQSKIPHRLEFDWNLIRHFRHEFRLRYASVYNLRSRDPRVLSTGLITFLYLGGVLGLAFVKDVRRRPGSTPILWLAVLSFTLLSCLQDNWYYLVYVLPAFAAAVAICAVFAWERHFAFGRLVAAGITVTVLLNLGIPGFRILHNDYRGRYAAAMKYLKQNAGAGDLIIGSGEMAFDLGFDGRVVDDCRLGFLSGRTPEYIVLEGQYYRFWLPWLSVHEPKTIQYIKKVLDERYEIAYDQRRDRFVTIGTSDLPYRIYKRKSGE